MSTVDGSQFSSVTIDGETVNEITIDGDVVYTTQTSLLIEDFEQGNINAWSGSTGSFSPTTFRVKDGTYALSDQGGRGVITSNPGDGLDNYPQAGDSFEIYWYIGYDNSWPNFHWCTQPTDDPSSINPGYYVDWRTENSDFSLWAYDGSNYNRLFLGNVDPVTLEWMRVQIDHGTDGTIAAQIEDSSGTVLASGSGTDTMYSSGGVQIRHRRSPAESFIDEIYLI